MCLCQARMPLCSPAAQASTIKVSGTTLFGISLRTETASAVFQVHFNIWNKFVRAADVPGGKDSAVKCLFWLIGLYRWEGVGPPGNTRAPFRAQVTWSEVEASREASGPGAVVPSLLCRRRLLLNCVCQPIGRHADQCCGHRYTCLPRRLPLFPSHLTFPFPSPFLVTVQQWMNLPESPCGEISISTGLLVLLSVLCESA